METNIKKRPSRRRSNRNLQKTPRYRDSLLWIRLTSQFLLLIQVTGKMTGWYHISDLMREDILMLINVVLGILSTLGVLTPVPQEEKNQK